MIMNARNKAREADKGGPRGNECNAVAGVCDHHPLGAALFAPMAVLRPPCLGATQAASARLALNTNSAARDRLLTMNTP